MKLKRKKLRVAKRPKEGKWFEVKPNAIDQKLFEEEREDPKQEKTRQLILEAFAELNHHPQRYGRNFKTMFPKKTWEHAVVRQVQDMATQLGDHLADWVEQALEWAQRISNGETWETLCNYRDRAKWERMVVWKGGHLKIVGGSRYIINNFDAPASADGFYIYDLDISPCGLVPLVVSYEE